MRRWLFVLICILPMSEGYAQRIDWKKVGQQKEGFYVGASLRPTAADANLSSTAVAALSTPVALTIDPGVAASIPVGYSFGNGFRLEIEPTLAYNQIDAAEGVANLDGDILQMGVLFNAFYEYANETKFNPYIGVGFGPMITTIDLDTAAGASVGQSADDIGVAWQIMPGVTYQFTPQIGVSIGYRYMGVTRTSDSGVVLKDLEMHAAEVAGRFTF